LADTTWKHYLPWGDHAFTTGCVLVVIACIGATIGFVGDTLSWPWLLAIGSILAVFGILGGGVFIAMAIPFSAIRVWRLFTEDWNRPLSNREKDWKQ
jgi:hypothetical protein